MPLRVCRKRLSRSVTLATVLGLLGFGHLLRAGPERAGPADLPWPRPPLAGAASQPWCRPAWCRPLAMVGITLGWCNGAVPENGVSHVELRSWVRTAGPDESGLMRTSNRSKRRVGCGAWRACALRRDGGSRSRGSAAARYREADPASDVTSRLSDVVDSSADNGTFKVSGV